MTTAAPTTEAQQTPEQSTHFFIITLDLSGEAVTATGGFNPGPGQTRQQAYQQIYTGILANFPDYRQLPVLFFSVERNQL